MIDLETINLREIRYLEETNFSSLDVMRRIEVTLNYCKHDSIDVPLKKYKNNIFIKVTLV